MANVYKGRNGAVCLGRVGKDGIIYEKINVNAPVGRIDFPDNFLYAKSGEFLGRIDRDGSIYKSRTGTKKCVGRIDYNGFIYDSPSGNNVIGHVERSEEMFGAAFFILD